MINLKIIDIFSHCQSEYKIYTPKGGLHKGVFWPPTKWFSFLQVNSLICVLNPGIPLLAHNSGCFRARTP